MSEMRGFNSPTTGGGSGGFTVATDLVRFSRCAAVTEAGESLNLFKGTYVMGERSICVSLIAPTAVSGDM